MAETTMDLTELPDKVEHVENIDEVDFLREGVLTLAQGLMEAGVAVQGGAERGERAPDRRTG